MGVERDHISKTQSKNFGGYRGVLLLSTHGYHSGFPTIILLGTSGASIHYNGDDVSITINGATIRNTDVTDIYWVFLGV